MKYVCCVSMPVCSGTLILLSANVELNLEQKSTFPQPHIQKKGLDLISHSIVMCKGLAEDSCWLMELFISCC